MLSYIFIVGSIEVLVSMLRADGVEVRSLSKHF